MVPPPEPRDPNRARRHERGRAPWLVGLGVSGAVHLLALILYSGIDFIPAVTVTPPTGRESALEGIRLLDVIVVPPQEDEEEDQQEEAEEEPEPVETEVPAPAVEVATPTDEAEREVAPGEANDYVAAADRLRVPEVDPRLYPTNRAGQYLGTEELLQLDLDLAVALLLDSIGAASARAEDALDWTWTDSDGQRWGVSPGKIHLGDITLPLPTSWMTGSSPWNREAELERTRQNAEIDRQAITGLILETWEERFRAVRERADRARRERLASPPDTAGGRI